MSAWTCCHLTVRPIKRLFPSFSNPILEGPSADSEEKREPAGDIDTEVVG